MYSKNRCTKDNLRGKEVKKDSKCSVFHFPKRRHTKCFAVSHNLLEIKDTKSITIEDPHRFDLVATSCVNKEVVSFNRKLQNTIKILTMLRL
jgi:hypothetical protein